MSRSERKSPAQLSDAKYLAFVENALKICRDNLALYKIPAENYERADVLYEKANLAYKANSLSDSRNKNTAREKNTAFKELKTYMNWFSKTLETNLSIPNDALLAMGLPSRNPEHHSKPAPADKGVISFKKIGILLRMYLDLQTHDSVRKHSSPVVATGTEWEASIVGSGVIEPLRSSKSYLDYTPRESDRGKILRVRGRWINEKFEPGPWSDWFEYIIN
jgi:hypothetical protein